MIVSAPICDRGSMYVISGETIRHPGEHQRFLGPLLDRALDLGKLNPRVDAQRFLNVEPAGGHDAFARLLEDGGTIGQVVFVLLVVRPDAVEGPQERRAVKSVATSVDLGDRPLLGAGVLLFDDPHEVARGIANDPAQPLVGFGHGRADHAGGLV